MVEQAPPAASHQSRTVKFRTRTVGLVQRHWVAITVTSLVSHLSRDGVLLVALRDVGVGDAEVGWAQVLAVFAWVNTEGEPMDSSSRCPGG